MQVTGRKNGKGPSEKRGIRGKAVLTDTVDEGKRIFLQSSISVLGLGKKAEQSLRREGIETVSDLAQRTEEEIGDIKEVRQKGMFTIKWAFAERGVSFSSSAEGEQETLCLSQVIDPRLGADIRELKLPKWTEKALQAAGIRQVGELSGMTVEELQQINELGRKRIREIREALQKFDLTLAGEGMDSQKHFMSLGDFDKETSSPSEMTVQKTEEEMLGLERYSRMDDEELLGIARILMLDEGMDTKEALGKKAPVLFGELERRLGRLGLIEFEGSVRRDMTDDAAPQETEEQLSSLAKEAREEIELLLKTVKPESLQATLKLLGKL